MPISPVPAMTAARKFINPKQAVSFFEALRPFPKRTPCPLGGIGSSHGTLDIAKM